MDEDNLIRAFGVWWKFGLLHDPDLGTPYYGLTGPFCLNCYTSLEMKSNRTSRTSLRFIADCYKCQKQYKFKESLSVTRKKAEDLSDALDRSIKDKISLDVPPTKISVRASDENYFIAAKIGQKDGKRVGIIYFGEKKDKQSKKDYSQIFIDLDDEQLRFDKSNRHPKDILLKFRAEFPDTTVDQTFKK